MPQRAPKDQGQGLGAHEVAAILEIKKRHPSVGPARIRTRLKRFKGWRVSVRAIARVLTRNGYELVHTASRPKGEDEVIRFEAPYRSALWQTLSLRTPRSGVREGLPVAVPIGSAVELRVGPERRALLLVEDELIDHHVSPAYRPRGRGKVESLGDAVQRELWHVRHFGSVEEAERALPEFFRHYNHRRAHMGIDGLTPADRFTGRWEEVMEKVQAASRLRQGAAALAGRPPEDPFVTEEILPDGPFEVLRLLIGGGRRVLAFLGHRVDLGEVKS